MNIGDTLKRIDKTSDLPATATIVGTKDGCYVLQAVEGFSSPFDLSANELRLIYGGDGQDVPAIDEAASWRRFGAQQLADANNDAQRRYVEERETALTPEQQFTADAL
jgi:hypothetical protein